MLDVSVLLAAVISATLKAMIEGLFNLLTQRPADQNNTNEELEQHYRREERAKLREREAIQREQEALRRAAEAQRREREANLAAEQAINAAREADQRYQASREREEEAKRREEESRLLAEEIRRSTLDAHKREEETNAREKEIKRREEEAKTAASKAQEQEQQTKNDLERALKGIQPEVWPTEEEFRSAKFRIQYDPEKLHFAVCGSSGSGKSSLINAFRGLTNFDPGAAPPGIIETTMSVTRYPDPHDKLPHSRFIWFDVPGAGTLNIPSWQYFNKQGLFVFDIVILVYDSVGVFLEHYFTATAYDAHSVSPKLMRPSYSIVNDTTSRYSSSDLKQTSKFKVFWKTILTTTKAKRALSKFTRDIAQLLGSYSSNPRRRIWTRTLKRPIWRNAKFS